MSGRALILAVVATSGCAVPLLGESSSDLIAQEMIRQAASAPWGQVYQKKAGCSPFAAAGNTPTSAISQWSFACIHTLRGIQRTAYYYATSNGTITQQYLHLSLPQEAEQSEAVFVALERRLQRAYGWPVRPFGLLYTGAVNHPPENAGQRWSIGPSEIILHRQTNKPLYGEMIGGPQLAIIERGRFTLIQEDEALARQIGLQQYIGGAHLGAERLRREVPQYALLMDRAQQPVRDRARREQATRAAALHLLKESETAAPERKALLLVAADEIVDRLADLLVGERGEVPDAATARQQLKRFGVALKGPKWDGGLSYDMDLLRRAANDVPNTEWGQIAFVRMLARGLDWGGFFGCQPVDQFAVVVQKGENYLAAHPGTAHRKELWFTLALAYETWWSASHAQPADTLAYEQFGSMRKRYLPKADEARHKAIAYYEEVVGIAPDSPEARMASRQLPRLKLNLDTGQRTFLCTTC
jgi:hypothetical protein